MNKNNFIVNEEQVDWEYISGQEGQEGVMRWKTFLGGSDSKTDKITMGIFEIPSGVELKAHHHSPSEAYYITAGKGQVLIGKEVKDVGPGDTVYIAGDETHGIKCIGENTLKLIWIFPTDTWSEVRYHMHDDEI